MGRQHGGGVDHRVALQRGFLLQRGIDPGRGQPERRLDGVDAGHADLVAGGVHDHELVRPDLAGAGVDFLDLDDVGVGLELHVVEDAHRRHHKAHFDRERTAQRLDLLGQAVGAVGAVDQRQQRIAEFDLEIVDLERGGDRLFRRGAGGRSGDVRRGQGCGFRRLGGAVVLARLPGQRRGAAAERQERDHRNARQQRQHQHHAGRHAERLRIAGELLDQRLVGGTGDAGLGDQQARRGRDDQRRHLRDQAVADGQHGVGAGGLAESQALLGDADDDAADDVDEDDRAGRRPRRRARISRRRPWRRRSRFRLPAPCGAPWRSSRRSGRRRDRRRSPSACRASSPAGSGPRLRRCGPNPW